MASSLALSQECLELENICQLSCNKCFTLPVQSVIDYCLYENFIVCMEADRDFMIILFDRITTQRVTSHVIEGRHYDSLKIVRLHNWSFGFCYDYPEDNYWLQPFSVDRDGKVEQIAPVKLLIEPEDTFEARINIYTSLDDERNPVTALTITTWEKERIYDISGTTVFPVQRGPSFILEEGRQTRCLVGRTLWVCDGYEERMNLLELSTGNLLRTVDHRIPRGCAVYRNRFIFYREGYISPRDLFREYKKYISGVAVVDSVSGEMTELSGHVSKHEDSFTSFRDVSDDGVVLLAKRYVERLIARKGSGYVAPCMWTGEDSRSDSHLLSKLDTLRVAVPSLSDIAKGCLEAATEDSSSSEESDGDESPGPSKKAKDDGAPDAKRPCKVK